jgi:hypothetical protein
MNMRESKSGYIQFKPPPELSQAIDEARRRESDLPTRPQIVTRLLTRVLALADQREAAR